MNMGRKALFTGLLAASALSVPQLANAKPVSVESRLDRLEAEMGALRGDLDQARAENNDLKTRAADAEARAQAAEAQAADATRRLAVLEARPAAPPAAAPADSSKSGGTTIKMGGMVKMIASSTRYSDDEVSSNSPGRDFYLPQQIPTGNASASRVTDMSAKQSRFWLNMETMVAGHAVKGYLEFDFQVATGTQGSQRTTNGYNPGLRRAYLQVDRWTIGQDWSTFQYNGALPESTDYVGGVEGTVFERQPLIRYTAPLGKGLALNVSLENPESGTANAGSPTLIENGDDRLPDFATRLTLNGKNGELSLAGLARQVRIESAGVSTTTGGYGFSLGGKLFFNAAKTGDARFIVTYGRNIGRYVGLNFAPDAVFAPTSHKLESADVFAVLGAVRVPLATGLRVNLMGSYQSVNYADSLTEASIATFNKEAWSAAANLFYSPLRAIDLGIEVRHGKRKLVNGADGSTDRVDVVAKYSF